MVKLLLKHEGLTLSTYVLTQDSISIGRSSECGIQLDDPAVSSVHARISRTPNPYLEGHYDYCLEDLKSTNGTKVNEERVTRHMLKNGDNIQVGIHHFVFDNGEPQSLETTAIYLPENE